MLAFRKTTWSLVIVTVKSNGCRGSKFIPALTPVLLFFVLYADVTWCLEFLKEMLLCTLLSTLPQLNAAHQFSRLQSVTQLVDEVFWFFDRRFLGSM